MKQRNARERESITCLVTEVGKFTDTMTLEDWEYYNDRLRYTLGRLTSLDDEVHKLLDDSEYDADLHKCEEYMESAKCAVLRTLRHRGRHLVTSTTNVTLTDACKTVAMVAPIAPSAMIKLSLIKVKPFSGDIDMGALLRAV